MGTRKVQRILTDHNEWLLHAFGFIRCFLLKFVVLGLRDKAPLLLCWNQYGGFNVPLLRCVPLPTLRSLCPPYKLIPKMTN